ncbi:MAG: helix-turn-helix domain-containing protein [Lachnospiraceae bacterium]|nr:helix-turn-helix domain-containing protein [Robinsoniella sp.]MDY3767591.1 helix-turn-helix domain-containing protein [Lachnospiraceae bacterium]
MKVLIVDDDILYLQSIRDEVHWGTLSVEKVYTASCAADAKTLLETGRIDLLITDIEMPGKSGLNLIHWCKEKGLSCLVIILSSFPDFSYAQQAIALGVSAYLLKTADKTVLEKMIQRAAAQILRQREENPEKMEVRQPYQIEQIRYYVSEHITEEISRDALAEYVGFTPDYLSAYFKKETGTTLSNYISNEKIQFAQRMLLQTDLPVSVIAQNLGFESSSYFTALFRKKTGMTPREYRKNRGLVL